MQVNYVNVIIFPTLRFVCFARMLPEFARLGLHDQANLLRRSVVEMLLLRDVIRKYPYESRKVGLDRGKFPELPVLTVSVV